jgi:hypothetical protein
VQTGLDTQTDERAKENIREVGKGADVRFFPIDSREEPRLCFASPKAAGR